MGRLTVPISVGMYVRMNWIIVYVRRDVRRCLAQPSAQSSVSSEVSTGYSRCYLVEF